MTFYNRVILIGYLTEEPDTRYTPSGSQVTRFALQITPDRDAGDGTAPQIIDVIALESDSSKESQPLSRGRRVLIEGKIHSRRWKTLEGQRRTKLEIIAERVYPL